MNLPVTPPTFTGSAVVLSGCVSAWFHLILDYSRSLALLKWAKLQQPGLITKSGFMLGLGETADEIKAVLGDLAETGCDMATIGQYLAPSLAHAPVDRYALPEEYRMWRLAALDLGFKSVAAGPLVRSSYKASHFFGEIA